MGKELKRRGMQFDFALASPAARVRETLDGLAEGYGEFRFVTKFEPRLYAADTATLLDLVHGLPEDAGRVLLLGHNPGLQRLIVELATDDENGLRDRVADKYPTAALAVIQLPAQHWSEVEPGRGTIAELIFPKELD
jgi:phosphohistidine phosphatase